MKVPAIRASERPAQGIGRTRRTLTGSIGTSRLVMATFVWPLLSRMSRDVAALTAREPRRRGGIPQVS
jgi:hypothetical protein